MERGACGNICSPSESELRSVVCTRQLTRHATRQRSAYHVSVPTRYGHGAVCYIPNPRLEGLRPFVLPAGSSGTGHGERHSLLSHVGLLLVDIDRLVVEPQLIEQMCSYVACRLHNFHTWHPGPCA